jgi:hypothetical protein
VSDHPIRLFPDDAAVRRIAHGLLDRSLPRPEWTHEAHLAACLCLLTEHPGIDLPRELPGIIRSYNEAVGGVNDDTQGYHETLTQLYIFGVRGYLAANAAGSLVERVNALLGSALGQRSWPLRFYSPDLLFSVAARRGWVEPDLESIPL